MLHVEQVVRDVTKIPSITNGVLNHTISIFVQPVGLGYDDMTLASFVKFSIQPRFRLLAASTFLMIVTGDTSSASQMRNSVSTVGDVMFRSSWLM
jgi:hypothetical protein